MRYSVLHVAYPLTPVGENAVGGSEQVLALLDRALTEEGHSSLVIAAEGSEVRGKLIPSPPARGAITEALRNRAAETHRRLISATLAQFPVDIVHMHSLDFHKYVPDLAPVLATLHLPPDWYPPYIFKSLRPHVYLNCVSLSQQRSCPRSDLQLPYITNGVDVERLSGQANKRSYALGLGRICPEKGFHFALEAAKIAGVEFVLAGEVAPCSEMQEYFRSEICPRLDNRRRFIGPVGFNAKRRLLLDASCLLIPSTVPETSSLVAMEAFAAGTPVIAFRSGALPEIVKHRRTGYLVSNVPQMAEAIAGVGQIDADTCRREALRRFSGSKMAQSYMAAYRRIIERQNARLRA